MTLEVDNRAWRAIIYAETGRKAEKKYAHEIENFRRHEPLLVEAHAVIGRVHDPDALADFLVSSGVEPRMLKRVSRWYMHLYPPDPDLVGLLPGYMSMRQRPDPLPLPPDPSPNPALGRPCRYCGRPAAAMDHVWPRLLGGDDAPNNLVPACTPCNSAKGGRSWLGDRCPQCRAVRHPGDVVTGTGAAFYSCRCGSSWTRTWDLQNDVKAP